MCLSNPSACSASLDASETALLVVLAALPLISMLWPLLCGSCSASKSINGSSMVGMRSGLLVIMASLAMGFIPTLFLLLASPHPCATAVGGCGSISCACGNYYPAGYTWMNVILTLAVLLVLREVADLPCWRTRAASALGALCILFTAINPERFALDPTQPADELHVGYDFHIMGLAVATALLVFMPFLRLTSTVLCCRQPLTILTMPTANVAPSTAMVSRSRRLRVLLPRAIHVFVLLCYIVAFAIYRPHGPDISDFCSPISAANLGGSTQRAAAACNAFPSLKPTQCAEVARLAKKGGHVGLRGSPLPIRYTCGFVNHTLGEAESLLLPPAYTQMHGGECKKANCELLKNARSMVLEFGMLFLVGAYVTLFHRADLVWVIELRDRAGGGECGLLEAGAEHDRWQRSVAAAGLEPLRN